MTTLAMGANAPLTASSFVLDVLVAASAGVDVTALQLYADGKVRGDGDMCFFNQTSIAAGAVTLAAGNDRQSFTFDLNKVASEVEKIVINATVDKGSFDDVDSFRLSGSGGIDMPVDTAQRTEKALILCEIYKRNGQWKIRNVSQGFNGGLQALAEHFGMEIEAPPEVQATQAAADSAPATQPESPAVDLSKVSLTKQASSVSLKKSSGKFGLIRVNLNWNQKQVSGGFLGMGKKGIDLDLGAFVEMADGRKGAVQALGGAFGAYDQAPFVKLLGDDRSGISVDGEWLEINGDEWSSIKRILIFAFIYEGVANWQETDGMIRMMVPEQPEVEVRMNELSSNSGDTMCAVALLENKSNQIHVSREVRLFKAHPQMDEAFAWGMQWQAGSK
jgi:tellurite resistance protein TerA